jgi:WD40 repeat protein
MAVYSNVEYLSNDLQWYSFEAGAWVDEWPDLSPSGGWIFRFSPDGTRLALPSFCNLGVWDVQTRQFVADVPLPDWVQQIRGVGMLLAYSPDGTRLVCGSGRALVVFDAASVKPVAEVRSGRPYFSGAAFHPSGRHLAATTQNGVVHLYDAATWQRAQSYNWDVGRLKCIAYSPDGTLAAAGSEDGRVVVWDVEA